MVQLSNAFDSSNHDDMNNFDPIPAGEYLSQIVESDIKETAAKTGKYIKLKFEILEGDYKGRFIWTNLNIINPNPVAVDIANKELATICRACGKAVIQDTMELHGIPILLKIRIVPAKGDYPASNSPTGYKCVSSIGSIDVEDSDGFDNTSDSTEASDNISTSDDNYPTDSKTDSTNSGEEKKEAAAAEETKVEVTDEVPWD